MPNVSLDENLVTYGEVADLLEQSVRTVHRLRKDGILVPVVTQTVRGGRIVRFRREDVMRLVQDAA